MMKRPMPSTQPRLLGRVRLQFSDQPLPGRGRQSYWEYADTDPLTPVLQVPPAFTHYWELARFSDLFAFMRAFKYTDISGQQCQLVVMLLTGLKAAVHECLTAVAMRPNAEIRALLDKLDYQTAESRVAVTMLRPLCHQKDYPPRRQLQQNAAECLSRLCATFEQLLHDMVTFPQDVPDPAPAIPDQLSHRLRQAANVTTESRSRWSVPGQRMTGNLPSHQPGQARPVTAATPSRGPARGAGVSARQASQMPGQVHAVTGSHTSQARQGSYSTRPQERRHGR